MWLLIFIPDNAAFDAAPFQALGRGQDMRGARPEFRPAGKPAAVPARNCLLRWGTPLVYKSGFPVRNAHYEPA
jgi:hypothetical protein